MAESTEVTTPDLDDAADELYGLPRDDFVPRRDELVKAARAAGDKPAATAIGKLRKPSQAAWLANLVARDHPDEVAALEELGASLRSAQEQLEGDALRTLSRQRHDLVNAMVTRGRRIARGEGVKVGESVARELERTVMAALADPRAARALAAGRLVTSLEPGAGLGDDAAVPAPPGRPSHRPPPRRPGPGDDGGARGPGDDGPAGDGGRGGSGDDGPAGDGGRGERGDGRDASEDAGDAAGRRERERREREERERRERAEERARRQQALDEAQRGADDAETAAAGARDEAGTADRARAEAGDAVRDLRERLDAAEREERAAADRAADARDARDDREREARYAADALERAQRRLAELDEA